jgi:hypothetical protein
VEQSYSSDKIKKNQRFVLLFTQKLKNMEMEKIIFFRNFLFRAFIVGFLFGVFYFIATILVWNTGLMSRIERMFNVNHAEVGNLTLSFFSTLRTILAFLFLAPCIALHWMIKRKNRTARD